MGKQSLHNDSTTQQRSIRLKMSSAVKVAMFVRDLNDNQKLVYSKWKHTEQTVLVQTINILWPNVATLPKTIKGHTYNSHEHKRLGGPHAYWISKIADISILTQWKQLALSGNDLHVHFEFLFTKSLVTIKCSILICSNLRRTNIFIISG